MQNEQLIQLENRIAALEGKNKNNFSGTEIFVKTSKFLTRLQVPHYASAPATCTVGEIIEVGGELQICSSANTWEIVGNQS